MSGARVARLQAHRRNERSGTRRGGTRWRPQSLRLRLRRREEGVDDECDEALRHVTDRRAPPLVIATAAAVITGAALETGVVLKANQPGAKVLVEHKVCRKKRKGAPPAVKGAGVARISCRRGRRRVRCPARGRRGRRARKGARNGICDDSARARQRHIAECMAGEGAVGRLGV